MKRIFLDTSDYSAFKRGQPQVAHRVREAELIHVNPIVLGELRAGFLGGTRLAENLAELARFLALPQVEILSVDEVTAGHYAAIHSALRELSKPIPTNDVWIAASAQQSDSVLITTDPHFARVAQVVSEILPIT